jgi:hypothetical protein
MWKTAISTVLVSSAAAQTAPNLFNKAPANVADALKLRASEFYQDHVDGKYRKAEGLVAEDSKDGFYAAQKPEILNYSFGDITYSENYTKAKIVVVGKIMMSFLGLSGPQLMDVPFPSYWKLENGKWVWYIYKDPNRMTPFGKANGKTAAAVGSDPAAAFASAPNLEMVLNGVKADRKDILLPKLVGASQTVTLTNSLPGLVTLGFDAEQYPGLAVKLEPRQLKTGQKAVLTIEGLAAKTYPTRVVRVIVQPSNQAIDVIVKFQ